MDLSKLSKALQPANLADTALVTISPDFKLRVCQMINYNQAYTSKLAEFSRKFPKHAFVKDNRKFLKQWFSGEQTPDCVSFMAHVILCGWELTDDDGADIPFNPSNAVQLLQTPVGRTVFGKLALAVQSESLFETEWSEDAIKN